MKKNIPFPTKGGSYVYDGKALKHESPLPVSPPASRGIRIEVEPSKPTRRAFRDDRGHGYIENGEEHFIKFADATPPPLPTSKRRKSRR